MRKSYLSGLMALMLVPSFAMVSCSENNNGIDDEPTPGPGEETPSYNGRFVFAAQVDDRGTTANTLITSSSLDEGTISAENNGLLNEGATQWIFYRNYLYALTYNQGNAGTTRSYYLNKDGEMRARDIEYRISRFSSYGMYDQYILAMSTGAGTTGADSHGYYPQTLLVTYLDVENETATSNNTSTGVYSMENFLGNGEYVTLSGAEQSGTHLYCGVIPMGLSQYGYADGDGKWVRPGNDDLVKKEDGGTGAGAYQAGTISGTQYPDDCWVAIYPNADFQNPVIAHTQKISYPAGRFRSQYYQTVWKADNGDVYVFSPSYAKTQTDARQQTVLPAGVCRIPAGATDFDDYYCNIEALAGRGFMRCWPAGGNYFIMQMYNEPYGEGFTGTAMQLAIFDADSKTLKYVTGLPQSISTIAKDVYVSGGKVYVAVTKTDGNPVIYGIDPSTAAAGEGLSIIADSVTGFGYLTPQAQ
ncbi:MAG: DUF4374 domain-containing protein [Muribaculaceae bacterium]|nr:DUF4374 domain-containing protein [Muribaculaceae bacterium]MDE6532055.1 DUF4374 domain-containing protein [Muribaculaceae bacterium]